jgi:hypothetical protein
MGHFDRLKVLSIIGCSGIVAEEKAGVVEEVNPYVNQWDSIFAFDRLPFN